MRRLLYRLAGLFCLFLCGALAMIWPQLGNWLKESAEYNTRHESYQVNYYVSGDEALSTTEWATITWANDSGETEVGDYYLPLSMSYTMHFGDLAHITARKGNGSGSLFCTIGIDDDVRWKHTYSTAKDAVVDCSGIVGH
jgi:hypothetical protein